MHVELIQELYADRSEPHKAVDESESVIKSLDFVNEDLEIFLQKLWKKEKWCLEFGHELMKIFVEDE